MALSNLPIPPEPQELLTQTRALLEDDLEGDARVVHDARFVADLLWEGWSERLQDAVMG